MHKLGFYTSLSRNRFVGYGISGARGGRGRREVGGEERWEGERGGRVKREVGREGRRKGGRADGRKVEGIRS